VNSNIKLKTSNSNFIKPMEGARQIVKLPEGMDLKLMGNINIRLEATNLSGVDTMAGWPSGWGELRY
jgi:hypothetical protein